MANSRERRTLRRALQEAGLHKLLVSPPPPRSPISKSIWKRISKTLYGFVGLVAAYIGLVAFWPWLGIEQSGSLDPHNPYQTLFFITNEGFLPITDVNVTCILTTTSIGQHVTVNGFPMTYTNQVPWLAYKHKFSLPCWAALSGIHTYDTAFLTVSVDYKIVHLPVHRPQIFHVQGAKARDGTWQWLYRD